MSDLIQKLKVFLGVTEAYEEAEELDVKERAATEDVVPLRRERAKKQPAQTRSKGTPTLVSLSGGADHRAEQDLHFGTQGLRRCQGVCCLPQEQKVPHPPPAPVG